VTLPSKRFGVWARLVTRFTLEAAPPEVGGIPAVGTTIVPVTDADALLLTPSNFNTIIDLDISAGTFVPAATVPSGQRWHLQRFWRSATTAASRMSIAFADGSEFRLSVQATAESVGSMSGIILDVGDAIGMESTDNVGDVTRGVHGTFNIEDVS